MIQDRKILRLIDIFQEVMEEFDEVVADHPGHLTHPLDTDASLSSLLDATTTKCLPLAQEIDAKLCLACDHFIGCERDENGTIVVHCWTHQKRHRLARGTQELAVPLNLD